MSNRTSVPQTTPVREALDTLREVADEMQYNSAGHAAAFHLGRLAMAMHKALGDLDARLAKLEQYQAEIEWAETAFGAYDEARLEEGNE